MAKDNNQSGNQGGRQTGQNSNQGSSGSSNQGSGSGQSGDNQGGQNQYDQSQSDQNSGQSENWQPGAVGEVQDPQNDGRLKENREAGRTLGTTEHSAAAPNAKTDDDDESGDNQGRYGGQGQQDGDR